MGPVGRAFVVVKRCGPQPLLAMLDDGGQRCFGHDGMKTEPEKNFKRAAGIFSQRGVEFRAPLLILRHRLPTT
jgi:hypothetical protein